MKLLISRFLDKVKVPENKQECWEWFGFRTTKGYGRMYVSRNKYDAAHRVSYSLFIGKIPDGMVVMHKCDNPRCVNPEHLTIGTYQENTQDCIAKKRFHPGVKRGEKNNMTKLTTEQAKEILRLVSDGIMKGKDIAKMFGVSQSTVSSIKVKRNWSYL